MHNEYMRKNKAIGLMSGTSVDSIDAAVVDIEESDNSVSVKQITGIAFSIPRAVRSSIFALFEDSKGSLRNLVIMNTVLGELFAEATEHLLRCTSLEPEDITVIGSHGQTIYHLSEKVECCGRGVRGSLQIGEGSIIARKTGIPTVTDFRPGDIAAGGSGAPLVPFFDLILSKEMGYNTAFQNIGGIGNVTFIEKQGGRPIAFDTGPGNMIVDYLASEYSGGQLQYDKDGKIGREGRVREDLLGEWMHHPFFLKPPPRSTGREEFGSEFFNTYLKGVEINSDLVRTAEEFTVRTIVGSYRKHLSGKPSTLIVTGGGAHNPVIMNSLKKELKECRILTGDEAGISTDYKEAAAFALLGYFAYRKRVNNVPDATGAEGEAVMGKLSLP